MKMYRCENTLRVKMQFGFVTASDRAFYISTNSTSY